MRGFLWFTVYPGADEYSQGPSLGITYPCFDECGQIKRFPLVNIQRLFVIVFPRANARDTGLMLGLTFERLARHSVGGRRLCRNAGQCEHCCACGAFCRQALAKGG